MGGGGNKAVVMLGKVGLLLLFLVYFVVFELAMNHHSHPYKLVPGHPMKVLMYHLLKLMSVSLGWYDDWVGACQVYYLS